jgi:hypothetical protein
MACRRRDGVRSYLARVGGGWQVLMDMLTELAAASGSGLGLRLSYYEIYRGKPLDLLNGERATTEPQRLPACLPAG